MKDNAMAGDELIVFTCVLIGASAPNNINEMQLEVDEEKPLKLTKFKQDNCSTISKRLVYFEVNVTTDPIKFGSTEMMSVILDILKDHGTMGSKLSAHLELYAKIGGQLLDYCPLIGLENCHGLMCQ